MTMSDSQRYSWHLYLTIDTEDINAFLDFKAFSSDDSYTFFRSLDASFLLDQTKLWRVEL